MTLGFCVCREGWTFKAGGLRFHNGPSLFKRIPRAGPGSCRELLTSSENSGDEKKFMEASRSLFSRPRRGLFSQPWEGDCVREQSSMCWEWARSPSYLWRPPSSTPKRATESGGGGVGGVWGVKEGRRTIDRGNKQSGEVYHSVRCYLRSWMLEESPFSPLMVSSVFSSQRHSSRSIQCLSTGSQGQQVQYIKKKKVGGGVTSLVWNRGCSNEQAKKKKKNFLTFSWINN